ncbi:uncharacterized, partial [Tachysurus ichikawai]
GKKNKTQKQEKKGVQGKSERVIRCDSEQLDADTSPHRPALPLVSTCTKFDVRTQAIRNG